MIFRERYTSFPGIPSGKYYMILMCFFIQVMNVSMVAYARHSLTSPITTLDITFWIFGISSCIDAVEILLHGNREFSITLADTAAILLGAAFPVILFLRVVYALGMMAEEVGDNLEPIYDIMFIFR